MCNKCDEILCLWNTPSYITYIQFYSNYNHIYLHKYSDRINITHISCNFCQFVLSCFISVMKSWILRNTPSYIKYINLSYLHHNQIIEMCQSSFTGVKTVIKSWILWNTLSYIMRSKEHTFVHNVHFIRCNHEV